MAGSIYICLDLGELPELSFQVGNPTGAERTVFLGRMHSKKWLLRQPSAPFPASEWQKRVFWSQNMKTRTFIGGPGHMAQSMYKCPVPFGKHACLLIFCQSEPVNGALGCRFLKKVWTVFLPKTPFFALTKGNTVKSCPGKTRQTQKTRILHFCSCLSGFCGF